MQDVNNDMDDLFRKAAEQYPLKTDGADWQKIAAGLQETAAPVAEEKEKRKRRALWLFWLLPLALLCGAVYYKSEYKPTQQKTSETGAETSNKSAESAQGLNVKKNQSSFYKTDDNNKISSSLSPDEVKNKSAAPDKTNDKSSSVSTAENADESAAEMPAGNKRGKHSELFSLVKNKKDFVYKQDEINSADDERADNKKNLLGSQPGAPVNRINVEDEEIASAIKAAKASTSNDKTDSVALHPAKPDSSTNSTISQANRKNLVKANLHKQSGFYVGVLASFDMSTIKLQRINKTGYGFELLLGYRFSKHLSAESGINWTKKNYYSTGKYFDKTNTGISPLSKIIYTNGSCAMYEIPAVVKYDFAQRKKSNWFATVGLSSYIMKDESYTYYANHTGDLYTATKKYSNSGNNLFSVASLSVGYQLQLNKHLSLRAEPYIKMPLTGIGIAKMPITSTGITAGFTRSF